MPASPLSTEAFAYLIHRSPVGRLHLLARDKQLVGLAFDDNWPDVKARFERFARMNGRKLVLTKNESPILKKTIAELDEFFRGRRHEFSIPCELCGTAFEIAAWSELRKIPFGELTTYGAQAKKLKRPQAIRAVAAANARNPISILIPCHRVIGKHGNLTGYSGGIEAKEALLEIETAM